jgi:SEC-C motif-containing protein
MAAPSTQKCCEVFHKSAAAHPDPESLLRARYSAFVKRVPKFLRATSHPDNPALKV